jgi:hypothetical protein
MKPPKKILHYNVNLRGRRFFEFAVRFVDLRRWNRLSSVLTPPSSLPVALIVLRVLDHRCQFVNPRDIHLFWSPDIRIGTECGEL